MIILFVICLKEPIINGKDYLILHKYYVASKHCTGSVIMCCGTLTVANAMIAWLLITIIKICTDNICGSVIYIQWKPDTIPWSVCFSQSDLFLLMELPCKPMLKFPYTFQFKNMNG